MNVEEWQEKYGSKRGLTDNEIIEFDWLTIMGSNIETTSDAEYQKRLFDFIDFIIHNDALDYISKLDKLHTLVVNKSLKSFSRERWETIPT